MENKGSTQPPPYTACSTEYPMPTQSGGLANPGYTGQSHPGVPSQGHFGGQQQMAMNNIVVTQVGGYAGPIYQPIPYDYSTQAWIACLCCFWPTGLLAIMKASESRDALARGDLAGAQSASNSARTMVRISYVAGILSLVVIVLGVSLGVVFNTGCLHSSDGTTYDC